MSANSGLRTMFLYTFSNKCGFNRPQAKYIFYFESTGSTIPPEVTAFMERIKQQCADLKMDMKIMDNMKMRHQYGTSECGMYCLYFIVSLLENTHNPEHFLTKRVTDDEMKNIRDIYFNKI